MFYSERYGKIIEILTSRNNVTVHYLAKKLFVSEPTIRRDLCFLEREGIVTRTYGGAFLSKNLNREIPLSQRENENTYAKEIIAKKAIQYIKNGNVIFLDASSTVSKIVKYLPKFSDLTVITNSPKTSMMLAEEKIKSFCTGGLLLQNSIAYVGKGAEEFTEKFNADVFFFSCRGVTEEGVLTDSSVEESEIRRVMLKHSKKNIFLCADNKIGKKYMYNFCSLDCVNKVISNTALPEAFEGKSDIAD